MAKLFFIVRWIKHYIFHKSFFLGLCISIGLFSPYIFGPDNLAEEIAELFIYKETGVFVDFTPQSTEEVAKNFHDILNNSNNEGGGK